MYYSQPYGYDFYGGYGGCQRPFGSHFAIVLVLFILLVIIGYRK